MKKQTPLTKKEAKAFGSLQNEKIEVLREIAQGLADIKAGRVKRVI